MTDDTTEPADAGAEHLLPEELAELLDVFAEGDTPTEETNS